MGETYNMNDMERQQEVYRSLIGRNDVVFDIGANIGNRSAVFMSFCKRVIAVEPQNHIFEQLKGRFRGSNVTTINTAIGAKPGTAKIHYPTDGSLGRHGVGTLSQEFMEAMGPKIFNLDKGWDAVQDVTVMTLDQLIAQHGVPGFIKLDIEGYEFEAVRGLSRKVNALSFEFHPQLSDEYQRVIGDLMRLGFSVFNCCLAETFQWELPVWVSGDRIIEYLERFAGCQEIYGDVYAKS